MHEAGELIRAAREAVINLSLIGKSTAHVLRQRQRASRPLARGPLTFVVGSPRSGTTFIAGALAEGTGSVDLGEVAALKRQIPELLELPEEQRERRITRAIEAVRWLSLAAGRGAIEQTPETSFVLGSVLAAYPDARALHMLRDGRDVVCSLLERGWLSADRHGRDDAGRAYGSHARFWVEDDRREEFLEASEATRCAWAWRRYVEAVRVVGERTIELRYEHLTADPEGAAETVAPVLEADPAPLAAAFAKAHDESVGRWQRDLTPAQVRDVEREAGALLRELGYVAA
ncbi:MAG TPA: sulfotransferase [Gaiellaceae bacterium]|nr:sulfotransferase [Gaiellaceae bacterium]